MRIAYLPLSRFPNEWVRPAIEKVGKTLDESLCEYRQFVRPNRSESIRFFDHLIHRLEFVAARNNTESTVSLTIKPSACEGITVDVPANMILAFVIEPGPVCSESGWTASHNSQTPIEVYIRASAA